MEFFVNLQKYRLGQHAQKQNEEQYKENNSESITKFEKKSQLIITSFKLK
jgi:hypothetical protein